MASGDVRSCEVCLNSFNETERKAVKLACGHDFCSTCLVRLKTAGSHTCPKCRGDWAELEVQALAGMALDAKAREAEEELLGKWTKGDDRCINHELAYEYWIIKEKMFCCMECIDKLNLETSELQLIEDAVPMIKSDIAVKCAGANEQMKKDLQAVDRFRNDLSVKLGRVSKYREEVKKLEEKLQEFLASTKTLQSTIAGNIALAKTVEAEMLKIKSNADIALMVSSRATLESLEQPLCLPALQEPESLLCSIACTYVGSEYEDDIPSSASFISGLMKATGNSTLPLSNAAFDADELKEGEPWVVDNSNCLTVLLALADRQPRSLRMKIRLDEPEPLPAAAVAAVAKAAMNCFVYLELFHSFFKPRHHYTDQELLVNFPSHDSHRLISFYGHLDAAGIAMLQPSVIALGLAISSAADAAAVSSLTPWDVLKRLDVSVSSNVAACDLRQLPSDRMIGLYFPDVTDARVDSVRPAVEALVPNLKFWHLGFPSSQLTAAGARRLVQQLRGAWICGVTIDLCGSWRPGMAEKKCLEEEIRSAVGCTNIRWDMKLFDQA